MRSEQSVESRLPTSQFQNLRESFKQQQQEYRQSTKAISLPVLPPILFKAFRVPEAAPLTILPADEETLDNPSEALDEIADGVSCALVAASEVVEACLRLFRQKRSRDWRRTARGGRLAGILTEYPRRSAQRDGRVIRNFLGLRMSVKRLKVA